MFKVFAAFAIVLSVSAQKTSAPMESHESVTRKSPLVIPPLQT